MKPIIGITSDTDEQILIQFINSSHHQAVKKLADGFEVFAVSCDGIIEGFYKKGYPFFVCVQWHPERSTEFGVQSLKNMINFQ